MELSEFAFYYPGPVWSDPKWIKNLMLFFDGVALLVPEYLRDKPFRVDRTTATELADNGLLKILEPETFIDQQAARNLIQALTDVIATGALDRLATQGTEFHELSYSRLGSMADERLAAEVLEELKRRGLARESKDGVSIPMHPLVRSLVLVMLSQILRPLGKAQGLDLQPATDRPEVHRALQELLSFQTMPSSGHVVSLDMAEVGVDLTQVPLHKVLKYRERHSSEYREYARDIREAVREISVLPPGAQAQALKDRKEEVRDSARNLRKISKRAWMKPASFALGVAGAVWTVKTGDVIGGSLAMGAGLLGVEFGSSADAGAFSYLFRAKRSLG